MNKEKKFWLVCALAGLCMQCSGSQTNSTEIVLCQPKEKQYTFITKISDLTVSDEEGQLVSVDGGLVHLEYSVPDDAEDSQLMPNTQFSLIAPDNTESESAQGLPPINKISLSIEGQPVALSINCKLSFLLANSPCFHLDGAKLEHIETDYLATDSPDTQTDWVSIRFKMPSGTRLLLAGAFETNQNESSMEKTVYEEVTCTRNCTTTSHSTITDFMAECGDVDYHCDVECSNGYGWDGPTVKGHSCGGVGYSQAEGSSLESEISCSVTEFTPATAPQPLSFAVSENPDPEKPFLVKEDMTETEQEDEENNPEETDPEGSTQESFDEIHESDPHRL